MKVEGVLGFGKKNHHFTTIEVKIGSRKLSSMDPTNGERNFDEE